MPKVPDTDPTPKPDRQPDQEQIIKVKAVQKRIDVGELNPIEGGEELDRLTRDSPSKE